MPADALLGEGEGLGFIHLMEQLPQERLQIAVQGVGMMKRALAETIAYVKDRKAFGKSIIEFQNTQFKLAELKNQGDHRRGVLSALLRPADPGQAGCLHRLDGEILGHRYTVRADR